MLPDWESNNLKISWETISQWLMPVIKYVTRPVFFFFFFFFYGSNPGISYTGFKNMGWLRMLP